MQDELLSNGAFALVNRLGAAAPGLVPTLNRFSAATLGERTYADVSHRVFCSPRRVRFVETEYAVPIEAVADVLRALRSWYMRTAAPVQFPVEVRFLAADDVWLSGAHGRETAYVAVHQYAGAPVGDSFAVFEDIVAAHDGRPHWGKQHTLGLERLRRVHPRLDDFLAVRDRLDPGRVLASPHLEHLLGT